LFSGWVGGRMNFALGNTSDNSIKIRMARYETALLL
jgi:hypothetical protein